MSLLGAMEYVKDTSSLCMQRSNSNVNIHLIYYVKWSTFRIYTAFHAKMNFKPNFETKPFMLVFLLYTKLFST